MRKKMIRNPKRKKLGSLNRRSKDGITFNVSKEEVVRLKMSAGKPDAAGIVASRSDRFWATLIDFSPFILDLFFRTTTIGLLAFVAGIADFILLIDRGQTIGKYIKGIRIVQAKTGENADLANLLILRPLPGLILFSFFSVASISGQPGYAWIPLLLVLVDTLFIFRNDRRCVHDLIAGTVVVNSNL